MNTQQLLQQAQQGFKTLKLEKKYKQTALKFLEEWLTDKQFTDYWPQIEHFIKAGHWDYLLDCFYQVMPFGTGGKRGEVGPGPNRINDWAIQNSAQGHSQYLLKKFGDEAKKRGIVISFDVRQFFTNKFFNDDLPNPVRGLSCKDLAERAAEVYAANGIKVFLFDGIRSTPELSFAIRYLKTVSGDMISASHSPIEFNGKKIYDESGGQLIPPFDEQLVEEVTQNVKKVKIIPYDKAVTKGLIKIIGKEVDDAFIEENCKLSLSKNRNIKIVYTPLHGCGSTSVYPTMKALGFDVVMDPKTAYASPKFENVTFNIPNPEVEQSFDTIIQYAKKINADIIINSDPDADRVGVMFTHKGKWTFINGNEIATILTAYVIEKRKGKLKGKGVIIKTDVTTNLMTEICQKNGIDLIGDLLVGFKYIGDVMNKLEDEGRIDNFLLGCEESHGYIVGNHVRDKAAGVVAVWLAELAAELKEEGKSLMDYLNEIYAEYGYFRNYLTQIRLPGAEGMSQIQKISSTFRNNKPQKIGDYMVESIEDRWDDKPIVSETDCVSKNVLIFRLKPAKGTTSIRITVRPSGTEPISKMYFEIGSSPFDIAKIDQIKADIEKIREELEKAFMLLCYKILGIDFPDRGFLLFWQIPIKDKMHYFEIEPKIEALKDENDQKKRQTELDKLLEFLGSDPIEKIDKAFKAKNRKEIKEYLSL